MSLHCISSIKVGYFDVMRICLICIGLVFCSGCQKTNAEKITFIQRNIKETDDKIMAKQKNQLIVPNFLKNGEINFEEETN